jgi:alkylation response protein AidB-like acyl-CoA dehydrogenase
MLNLLVTAQIAVDSMIELCDDLAFMPSEELAGQALVRKTICANAVIAATEKALEVCGGAGFMRKAASRSGWRRFGL